MSDTPFFFKRDAKVTLNAVNSGSLQYVATASSDFEIYSIGDSIQVLDHQGNWVMDGYVVDKSRSKVNIVTLYVEDAGLFLRDYNVEDNAPEDGEPVCCTVRELLQQYILPASWGLDTSALAIYDEYESKFDWVVRYAVRNGTSLKHVNNLCDMMRVRWVAKWNPTLSRFDLCIYPLVFMNTGTFMGMGSSSGMSLKELVNTTQFETTDSSRNFVTAIQVVGSEQECGQQITYLQKDFTGATRDDDPYAAWGYGYTLSSDTYCKSLDLSPGTTIVELMDSDHVSGWATQTASVFQFNHDSNYYRLQTYNGAEFREIVSYPVPPWKYIDPATAETVGLLLPHALNDEIFANDVLLDRVQDWVSATTWAWIGTEVISFEKSEEVDQGVPGLPSLMQLKNITRGLNGVRYVHRKGSLVRPYYASPPSTGPATGALLYTVGTKSVSVSAPGFVEQDGLDKFADGVLGAATFRYSGKTDRLVATLDSRKWYPGAWVESVPASVNGATLDTTTPEVTMIKSVSYSLGKLVSVDFGTSIPESIRGVKEGVTALDIAMQKTSQSAAGEILDLSKNKVCALMKISKTTKERFRGAGSFDEGDETNYVERWVRVK